MEMNIFYHSAFDDYSFSLLTHVIFVPYQQNMMNHMENSFALHTVTPFS